MAKTQIKYAVRQGTKPGTEETVRTPYIVERKQFSLESAVEYALNSGYIRGQLQDMIGVVTGFFQAINAIILAGDDVSLKSWFRFALQLGGSVGEDNTLTDDNTLSLRITALKDSKPDMANYSCQYVGDVSGQPKLAYVMSDSGTIKNVIIKTKDFGAYGSNFGSWDATKGDKFTVTYEGLGTPISLSPARFNDTYLGFTWPAALAEVEDGTVLTFKLTKVTGSGETTITWNVTKDAILKDAA